MNKITVTVSGCTRVGKSAISQLIAEALLTEGFQTGLTFINDEHEPRKPKDHRKALYSIKENTQIEVKEQQNCREDCK